NTALTWLKCDNNQLTTLDVSANTALTGLDCDNNQLTTLDLKNLTNLQWFWVSPQRSDVVIPVIKRDTYEVDATAFAGRSKAKIDGRDLAADGKVELSAPPKLVTYTFKADSPYLSDVEKTVTVEAKNFDYSYLATLDAGTNGTLTFDGTPSTSAEILLAEKSEPTFTVTPASGYQVATLTVNGEDVKESLVAKDATSQTLTLPPVADTVAIAATFEKIPAPPKPPTPIVNFYSVTATAENGTITSDHATLVREGSSVKCTFSPKESYAFESVSVNGELVKATEEGTTTAKTYSYNINSIYSNTTIHVSFKAVEPPVDPIDPIDPPKPPVDPTDPVDPPKPPVDSVDPINPPTPPAVPDNGGNGNNNGGNTTIVERTNTVVVPAAPQAATLATPATLAATAVKTEAPAKATADTATLQGQLENPALGAQAFDNQHSHIPLALLLLAVWLVGGFAVIRQRKHTHDAIDGASY
ncbi:MAG: leucine-rich repeat domain-containing protein, partial [Raoultibacter sp.]